MSRKYQDQNYQSGQYQTSYPYPPGQFPHPHPSTYNDRPPSHHAHSSYPEDSLQYPPSGQGHDSRAPSMGTVPFSEPQHCSTSPPQSYSPPSQTTPDLSVAAHYQHERRGSHGHFSATGSSSDSQRSLSAAGASSDTGGSNFYSAAVQPHHRGGYTAIAAGAQPQDWNAAVYEGAQGYGPRSTAPGVPPVSSHRQPRPQVENAAVSNVRHDSRPKAPPNRPPDPPDPFCRYPRCGRHVFFDRRVNELREWCSDQHMQAAIMHGVEKPCNTCRVWPRRNGYTYCSGNVCRYPGY